MSDQGDRGEGWASLRVLFIEDNLDIAELSKQLLAEWGHQVRTAGDGREALAALDGFAPDVVFIDIGLPGMSGYEVARHLRAQLPGSVRLVAVSGYSQADHMKRANEVGFDSYLVKPILDDQLAAVLSRCRPHL